MRKETTKGSRKSSPVWETLEGWARVQIQGFIQGLLEEEVTELLGREKSERKSGVDAAEGYRNGYGKARRLTMSQGTIGLRRPRVRGLDERFESRILPMFKRRTKEVGDLIPELYLHGLSLGDFDLALRGLLGEEAPLSASTVGRLKEKWKAELEEWNRRPLNGLEVVYLWVDGIYIKAGLEKGKAALLVVLAALANGRKVVVAVVPGHRESTESWAGVLRDLKARGMNEPRLVIGDGHLGIWGALRNVYPEADEQRCWNHRLLNLLDKISKKEQAQALLFLKRIPYAPTLEEALRLKSAFQEWCRKKGFKDAARLINVDWDRMVTFYRYPQEHWQHIRTTNPVESPFAALRLRTDAAKRFKNVENATAIIWKMLMVAETRFRRLKAPHLMKTVFKGAKFQNGIRINNGQKRDAA